MGSRVPAVQISVRICKQRPEESCGERRVWAEDSVTMFWAACGLWRSHPSEPEDQHVLVEPGLGSGPN